MPVYKKVLIAIGSLVAFALLVVWIALYATSGLTSTIKDQLAALKVGDFIKAYSYTSKDFQNATSLSDFQDFVNHYPAIKNNDKASFSEREIKNDTGRVRGTLYSTDGAATPIEYLLVKEKGSWKILGIQVNPAGLAVNTESSDSTNNQGFDTAWYDNVDSRYKIQYPTNWEYEKSSDGTIIFSGKRGTQAYYATVNVQTVLAKKTGGDFSTVKEFMADIKKQAVSQSPGVKFLESGDIEVTDVTATSGKNKGLYSVFTYQYKGKEFKQWQVAIMRDDHQVFYAWAYTAPSELYSAYVGVGKSMLESWIIY